MRKSAGGCGGVPGTSYKNSTACRAVAGRRWQDRGGVERLYASDVRCVESLFSGTDLELHLLSLGERLESVHLNRREVHEHIFTAFLLNEAVSLGVIEPLHLPSGHSRCLLLGETILPRRNAGKPLDLRRPI